MHIGFLSDAIHYAITMNTKVMEELENAFTFDNIMDEDFRMFNELTLLVSIVFFIHFIFFGEKI
jgi:hypothetical protein